MSGFWAYLMSDEFMPHGHCYQWQPDILWLNVGSDMIIAGAYYSIPLALVHFARQRKDTRSFGWLLYLFAAFIFACGTTHIIEVYNVWNGAYRFQGAVKLLTAIVSVATAVVLWPLIPKALAIPSVSRLTQEVQERTQAQHDLKALNDELEARVEARTADLKYTASLVESSNDAIIGLDLDGQIRTWNRGAVEIFGYPVEQAIGADLIDLIVPEVDRAQTRARLDLLRSGERFSSDEARKVRADGMAIDVSTTWSPIIDDTGTLIGMSLIYSDISSLVRVRREAESSQKEIERFTYVVSHDLRSPLINIKGFCHELKTSYGELMEHLNEGPPDEAKMAACRTLLEDDIGECLTYIEAGADRMETLITAVLKLSRLGRRSLEIEEIDLYGLTTRIADSLQHQLDQRGARLTIEPLPRVLADAVAMEQIMGNLLSNAVKYLDASRHGEIEVDARTYGEWVIIKVHDNGRGIAEGDVERIFQPFTRVGRTQDVEGEGMGLSYVRALVKQLGGEISCRSTLGKGSVFTVKLPATYKAMMEVEADD